MRSSLAALVALLTALGAAAQQPSPPAQGLSDTDLAVYRAAIDSAFAGAGRLVLRDSVAAPFVAPNDTVFVLADIAEPRFREGRAMFGGMVPLPIDGLRTSVALVGSPFSTLKNEGPPADADCAEAHAWFKREFPGADGWVVATGVLYSRDASLARVEFLSTDFETKRYARLVLRETAGGWRVEMLEVEE